jgi:glycolate oxidase FAD binding subunit
VSLHGSGSHGFLLGDFAEGERLELVGHRGILDYQPTELTIRARAGTPLVEIEQALAEGGQQLPTDFPRFAAGATLGGAVAIGHSGPARPFRGAIRDHVLGIRLLGDDAGILHFGGQVMKNVAGYDVSRLMCGSRGSLGALLEITLKVIPRPEQERTLVFEEDEDEAIRAMNRLAGLQLPISGQAHVDGRFHLRLQGSRAGVAQAAARLGGETLDPATADAFWRGLNEQSHPFFNDDEPLWRIVVPTATPRLELECEHRSLIDWGGGLRWLHARDFTDADSAHVRNVGGFAEVFRGGRPSPPAATMSPLLRKLHRRVKKAFDPGNIFNPKLSNFGS